MWHTNLPKLDKLGHGFMASCATAVASIVIAFGLSSIARADSEMAQSAAEAKLLRVCASAEEAPYSSRDGSGFENRIAEAVAEAMGRKAHFFWSSKPAIYAVRDQLGMNICDVVMGMDAGDQRVATSRSYYTAPYVFIQRKDSPLKITDWQSPDLEKAKAIGFVEGTPADTMLTQRDLWTKHITYSRSLANFQSKRNKYTRIPPDRMVAEVANGTADLAVGFAPEVARYVKANDALKLTVIPDNNSRVDGERVPHHFEQSIGVRKGDNDLLAEIDAALAKAKPKIETILKDEGIPLVAAPPRT